MDRDSKESQFTRPDAAALAAWLDDYSLGHIWEKNILGGRLSMSSLETQIADYCRKTLPLGSVPLSQEYFYHSLPLCVIDAVFSIGVNYESVKNVVRRSCDFLNIPYDSTQRRPERSEQRSIGDFLQQFDDVGLQKMTDEVFRNRQRTSTKNGILKSEATYRFAHVLQSFNIQYLQDTDLLVDNTAFASAIYAIPGQKSGIALRYFFMLSGQENFVKPDRMIARFVQAATNLWLTRDELQCAIVGACALLARDYPHLTPRLLDNLIWKYQRQQ